VDEETIPIITVARI